MRIAFATYGTLDLVSGGFAYDRALVQALGALGHQVRVLSLPWVGYGRAVLTNLRPRPAAPTGKDRDGDGDRDGVDVVIEDELIHPSRLRARAAALWGGGQLHRAPRVALLHNLTSQQPRERYRALKALAERRYLRGVDGWIAVCADTLAQARALAGTATPALVARAGGDHIDPGGASVDQEQVAARAAAPGPLRILHVATVAPHKGLDRLLRALAALPDVDFRLDVVGDQTSHPRYARAVKAQAAATAGLAARTHWHGVQRGAALWAWYRNSHLLALPSDREAYSLACLEALAFGLPVLATARGGLAEMFTEPAAGLLLDPDDGAAWTAALAGLAVDRGRLAERGRAALACHRAHAPWARVALTVQEFLRQVMAAASPPPETSRA